MRKIYPQYGTNFWGDDAADNYGFGSSDIKGKIENVTNRLNNSGFNVGANSRQRFVNSDYTINSESLIGKQSSYFLKFDEYSLSNRAENW